MSADARQGLNEAEAVMLRLAIASGDDVALWDGLDPHAARAMTQAHEAVEAPEEVLSHWHTHDASRRDIQVLSQQASFQRQRAHLAALPARWQRIAAHGLQRDFQPTCHSANLVHLALGALLHGPHQLDRALVATSGPFDPGFLCFVSPRALPMLLQRIGIFELAEVLRHLDRRQIGRILKEMPEYMRHWLREDFARERTINEQEQTRARDVFVAFQKNLNDWPERALHTGLFFVATCAGERYNTRIQRLSQRLSDDHARALLQYDERAQWSSRRGLDLVVRTSLGHLWQELHALCSPVSTQHD